MNPGEECHYNNNILPWPVDTCQYLARRNIPEKRNRGIEEDPAVVQ